MVFMPHWPKNIGSSKIISRLDNALILLKRLDNPHMKIPPVLHITGTNGKGSTISYIKNILQKSLYRVHLYTSPHLLNFNERIVINGRMIGDQYLFELTERCRIVSDGLNLTFFEVATAVAFLAFAENDADLTLLEVGVGGEFDPTNASVNTILSIITTISKDHTEILGDNERQIALIKSGIMRPNVPCVISTQSSDAMKILLEKSSLLKAPVFRENYEWSVRKYDHDHFLYQDNSQKIVIPMPNMRGAHQILNAGCAVASCCILASRYEMNISIDDIAFGIKSTFWPARLQKIEGKICNLLLNNDNSNDSWEIFLDGAHNDSGASILAQWIKSHINPRPVYLIVGLTRGKDIQSFLKNFEGVIDHLCSICVRSELRACTAQEILQQANNNIGINNSTAHESLEEAILHIKHLHQFSSDCNNYAHDNDKADHHFTTTDVKVNTKLDNQLPNYEFNQTINQSKPRNNPIILICGSLYLMGDIYTINTNQSVW